MSCQYDSLWAIQKTLPAISATLNDIKAQPNPRRSTDAWSLLSLIDAEFILHLILFEDLFHTAKFLSDTLQSPDLLLETATALVQCHHGPKRKALRGLLESHMEQGRGPVCHSRCRKTSTAPTREETSPKASQSAGLHNSSSNRTSLTNYSEWNDTTEAGAVLMGTSALNPKNAAFLTKESF